MARFSKTGFTSLQNTNLAQPPSVSQRHCTTCDTREKRASLIPTNLSGNFRHPGCPSRFGTLLPDQGPWCVVLYKFCVFLFPHSLVHWCPHKTYTRLTLAMPQNVLKWDFGPANLLSQVLDRNNPWVWAQRGPPSGKGFQRNNVEHHALHTWNPNLNSLTLLWPSSDTTPFLWIPHPVPEGRFPFQSSRQRHAATLVSGLARAMFQRLWTPKWLSSNPEILTT